LCRKFLKKEPAIPRYGTVAAQVPRLPGEMKAIADDMWERGIRPAGQAGESVVGLENFPDGGYVEPGKYLVTPDGVSLVKKVVSLQNSYVHGLKLISAFDQAC
jgi:hypothetical protein